ncbi:GNAT family N-acetyltransferase [Desulfatibacillum aliphaticivorans]|uniref:GNAT family N-acetyltransferase n=1 Tax=Desulfatibacillum aliphaticivorans TaxID=218208 RepID=UPI000421766B|nr:GNAT family N-acetyltransferase [Desulfatibacillum aliphaticivorans]
MTWQAKSYKAGDEHGILALRRAVFGQVDPVRARLNAWKWQFLNNPAGRGFIMLAEDQGRIVGQYAAIPVRMLVDGVETLCGYSCDTMVHPRCQGRRVFTSLARQVYAHMESEHGIGAVWGFPNKNSMPGFIRSLGWRRVGDLLARVGFTSFSALLKVYSSPRLASGWEDVPMERISPQFDALWEAHKPRDGVIQVRDRAYLQWRYLDLPDFGYKVFGLFNAGRLQGYYTLRVQHVAGLKVCVLADCFPLDSIKVMEQAVKAAKFRAASLGCFMLTAMFPISRNGLASRLGFYPVPRAAAPKVFHLAGRFEGGDAKSWMDPLRWHLTLGDTDVV